MKKHFKRAMFFVPVVILLVTVFAMSAIAAPNHKAVFVVGQKSYTSDGITKQMDAAAFIENGRTYVPIRYLGYAIGVRDTDIGWSSPTATLMMDGITVKLSVKNKTYYVNGQAKQMDVAPVIKNGRTYLPARFVAEAFGYVVDWNKDTRVVSVYPPGEQPPVAPVKNIIDITNKGEPITGQPWAKYFWPNDKVTWIKYDQFSSNSYRLNDIVVSKVDVGKDYITVTQDYPGPGQMGATVGLWEGGDVLRVRESAKPYDAAKPYNFEYSVVNDRRDHYSGWSTADITKVSHIFIYSMNTILVVDNPLYNGGK